MKTMLSSAVVVAAAGVTEEAADVAEEEAAKLRFLNMAGHPKNYCIFLSCRYHELLTPTRSHHDT